MPECKIPSADRANLLTDFMLLIQPSALLNGTFNPIEIVKTALGFSEEGKNCLVQYGDNHEEIMQELLNGSYSLDDLHNVISDLTVHADNIDGNMNMTSIAILSHTGEIQQLSSRDPVDHNALFKEVIELGIAAQTANILGPITTSSDRDPADVSKFQANMLAMSIIAMNIAEDNGVNVQNAMNELQTEMGMDEIETKNRVSSAPTSGLPAP